MDKKSKILLALFSILIVLSIIASYYRVIIMNDYLLVDSSNEADLEEWFSI